MTPGGRLRGTFVGAALVGASAACASLSGLTSNDAPDAAEPHVDAGHDAGAPHEDAGRDAGHDAGHDAGQDAANDAAPICAPVDGGYHDIATKACWSTFVIPAAVDSDPIYTGGTFDGRYVYFVSGQTGMVLRYDSQAAFSDQASWSTYVTTLLQPGDAYEGVLFDGRYLYLIPGSSSTAIFIRYDTTAPFLDNGSWTAFTLTTTDPIQYQGGTFDGRYLYFAPVMDGNEANSGLVERYDTQGPFVDEGSWTSFDTTTIPGTVGANAASFYGAVFDGKYVYLMPSGDQGNVVARYDTSAATGFASTMSWEVMDTGTINPDLEGFYGGMFDGKYVYLVPAFASEVTLQYDISQPFTSTTSWNQRVPDPGSGMIGDGNTPQFQVGAFDGRFVYYVPSTKDSLQPNGFVFRHDDTSGPLAPDSGAGWSEFNTLTLNAGEYGSAVFDGKYLYLSPIDTTAVARFEARDTSSQPDLPHYFGSFF